MINLTKAEKDLILAAIKIEKEVKERFNDDESEEIEEIELEITKENIFLSRIQIDVIIYYLGALLDRREMFDQGDVLSLESKLEQLIELP
ncbi:hypothetical protein MKJ01_05725 [Chryseobacterium sp. SSA4.19]|uniref:hypothetical protein n=1 Tax=Chryseobacterium sp. SSA4.19 TaxID=2919915 RepID=UPI001F4E387F|nr:hypothetical protein [Chryseobacterium sp. SSA4.19]MCJ8153260.1 hypothetical protein [Chryseobacterium sp. SSA4.19]